VNRGWVLKGALSLPALAGGPENDHSKPGPRFPDHRIGTQQSAASLLGNDGGVPVYPIINVLLYSFILSVLLLWRFRNEDIV
jgi:hypothetical protein